MPRLIDPKFWPATGGDLHRFCPFVWAQAFRQNTCGGFALAGAFSAMWNFQFNTSIQFSGVFSCAAAGLPGDHSLSASDGLVSLQENGCCLEATIADDTVDRTKFPPSVFEEAMKYRLDNGYTFLSWMEMISAVLSNFGTMAGFFRGENFKPDKNGILPEWDGKQTNDHNVWICGPYKRLANGKEYVGMQNSYGAVWGVKGRAWAPKSYFTQLKGMIAFGGAALVSGLASST